MAPRVNVDERLRDVPLFAACSKRELRQISRLMSPLRVEAGTVLAAEGKMGAEFVVIIEGTATVSRQGETIATLGPGRWFGEVALLDASHVRTATVVADMDMALEVIDGPAFDELIDEHPRIARKILQGLARLVAANA